MADLITVQEYKNAEGLASQKDDQRLDIIVPQVSNLAKKYCGTSFIDYYSSGKTETISIDDNFTSTIIVSESPLIAVSSVKERTSYGGDYDTLTTADFEYYVDIAADAIVRTTKDEHKKRRSIAGATLQNQGTSGVRDNTDFPDHIKRVLDLYRVII